MNSKRVVFAAVMLAGLGSHLVFAQDADSRMSFFLTSTGPGNGADLGGQSGADRHCQFLAAAVGLGNRTWHAYLSTSASGDQPASHARDRIGDGPWYNSKGVRIAQNVADLHSDSKADTDSYRRQNLTKETQLNEKGEVVNGRGDTPNRHDILTGSQLDGRAFSGDSDTTCKNWTSSSEGSARVGPHDRKGGGEYPSSWNSAHGSSGCSQDNLRGTGGDGLFYCFAID